MPDSGLMSQDPLIAALPPATDYITYLTLLEYNLTPENLDTLNRLLASDDGKLAEEIGWDLLKLVLPMLENNPKDATTCLELIARRGNPREVVVQVAEELEKIGRTSEQDNYDDDNELEDDNGDNDLDTFPGEATRIHLGKIKLDGLPEPDIDENEIQKQDKDDLENQKSTSVAEIESMRLQVLLNLLGILHPRIKTQHPSRFLATSLPAALGAYRRSSVDANTTTSFLALLRKLSGKQKPALPPRTSSNIDANTVLVSSQAPAPLPDPEADIEQGILTSTASELEKSINTRLLQAVLLEVLDEYMSSFPSEESPRMSWTHRLREELEPGSILPRILSETGQGEEANNRARDEICIQFMSCATDLSLDITEELSKVVSDHDEQDPVPSSTDLNDEISEYPTSPTQIDFPTTGLILLCAAEKFYKKSTSTPFPISDTQKLIGLIMPLSKEPVLPSLAVQDALLSLLYQTAMTSSTSSFDPPTFTRLLSILTQAFTITPSSQIRDDAHHIATQLLHTRAAANDRLKIIKQTIHCSTPNLDEADSEPIPLAPPLTEGALKAVGVDWLKDEFRTFLAADQGSTTSTKGLDPTILETDTTLRNLLFTTIPPPPAHSTPLTIFLCSLPFYISVLNLLCILLSNPNTGDKLSLHEIATTQLHALETWRDLLLPFLLGSNNDGRDVDEEMVSEVRDSGPDVFALDDACGRLRVLVEKV